VTNVTGAISEDQGSDPGQWERHLREADTHPLSCRDQSLASDTENNQHETDSRCSSGSYNLYKDDCRYVYELLGEAR